MAETPTPEPERGDKHAGRALTLWQTVASVAASFFGVQSGRNRERDFKHGKASHFIIVGLVMTVLFVLLVWGAVRFALTQAGL